ncbi:MAG: alpha/beta hydrolase [Pseudomonadota bacterium]|nr:alpha/beta hydrolase [Pseudomonadota bacterium]
MSTVTTADNCRLYVKDWGQGRPVVMLHGWPLSSDSFDDLSLAIAGAGMRAISYDRRGFGRSEQPWTGYDYDTLADDLAAVMTQCEVRDATLLGFSMGGGEVARYMSRHGGKGVTRAVLVASVVPYMLKTSDNPDGVPQSTFDAMAKAMKEDRAKFWSGFFKDFYGVGMVSHPVSDEVLEWSRDVSMQAGLKPTLACAEAFASTDFRPDLASFKVPTLIIHGSADKTVPIDASGRKAAAGIANSTLIEYDGAPHGLLASHKDRVIADVLRFVQGDATGR